MGMMSSSPDAAFVVLTEANWGSALHALRSARRVGGATVAITWACPASVLRVSRRCDEAYECDDASELQHILTLLGERYSLVAVLPLSDRLALTMTTLGDFHERVCVARPNGDLLEELLSKSTQVDAASSAGLSVPATALFAPDSQVRPTVSLPAVVKPDHVATHAGDCRKIETFSQIGEFERRLDDLAEQRATVVVQSLIRAPESAIEFAIVHRSDPGAPLSVRTGRKRRIADPAGGVMVAGETTDLPDVAEAAAAFCEEVGFVGVGGVEFIRSDGKLWFIECNPRLEAIHFLAAASGLDTAAMEFAYLAGRTPPPATHSPTRGWVGSAAMTRLSVEPSAVTKLFGDRLWVRRSEQRVTSIVDRHDPLPAASLALLLVRRGMARLLGAIR